MAISSIWSGSGSSLSSLLSTVSQYNVSKNIDYEVLAKRLQESGTTTADSTTASNTTTVAASYSTKTAESVNSGTTASSKSGTASAAVSDSTSSDSSSESITDLYEKTQEKVQERDDLAFLSYYSRGTSVKTEGASERASLIRSLLNGTTGNFFDAYA